MSASNRDISILIIYTGGTIGMIKNPSSGSLEPLNFENIFNHLPELQYFSYNISAISFEPPIDSSEANPDFWGDIADIIASHYDRFDGFVILHGTDTMAYSASALSFMIENLTKPVIFTGSQLPLGSLRTDGKENIISSIEIAAAKRHDQAVVPEVCIYFENKLFRGNRTTKHNAEYFNAFRSDNYPPLAETGIHINYHFDYILHPDFSAKTLFHKNMDPNIAIVKLFPGITRKTMESILQMEGLKAVILETYGEGNTPSEQWFFECIQHAVQHNMIILNISQCKAGSVNMGKYVSSLKLQEMGVISGHDMTLEAAVTKIMFLLGMKLNKDIMTLELNRSLCGEIKII